MNVLFNPSFTASHVLCPDVASQHHNCCAEFAYQTHVCAATIEVERDDAYDNELCD